MPPVTGIAGRPEPSSVEYDSTYAVRAYARLAEISLICDASIFADKYGDDQTSHDACSPLGSLPPVKLSIQFARIPHSQRRADKQSRSSPSGEMLVWGTDQGLV